MTDIKSAAQLDIDRWKIGHRFFFAQIQGLICAVMIYKQDPSGEALDDISDLLLGSAVMMQFSADLLGGTYEPVRFDMEQYHEGFTGLYSADHAALVRIYHELSSAKDMFPEEYALLRLALETLYLAHSSVCKKFAGDTGSLANDSVIAWRTILAKFLPRVLKKAGIDDSGVPKAFE